MSGRVIAVTGGSGGIGAAVIRLLVKCGATVVSLGRECSSCIYLNGDGTVSATDIECKLDLRKEESFSDAFTAIKGRFNLLDGLVNCGGSPYGGVIGMIRRQELVESLEVNFCSHVMLTQRLFRLLRKGRNCSIVNVSSISAFRDDTGTLSYSCAKAALNQATKVMAREFAPYGIRVNAVAPGVTSTAMMSKMSPKAIQKQLDSSADGRVCKSEEVASLIRFLLSDTSSHITGQVIRIDGGQLC